MSLALLSTGSRRGIHSRKTGAASLQMTFGQHMVTNHHVRSALASILFYSLPTNTPTNAGSNSTTQEDRGVCRCANVAMENSDSTGVWNCYNVP